MSIEFKGHTHMIVKGDAETPARFWTYQLYTASEVDNLDDKTKLKVRKIQENDIPALKRAFS